MIDIGGGSAGVQGAGADNGSYTEAVNTALERLEDCGFEWGPGFALHAPMAAEALAWLGHGGDVGGWVAWNRRHRSYRERPTPRWEIGSDDWADALGDFPRVADWAQLFERQLEQRPWREVLAQWWPRLQPGLFGALGHGLIRTAHAVRSLGMTATPTPFQLRELAQGLGYWAARYYEPRLADGAEPAVAPPGDPDAALRGVIVDMAGRFADQPPQPAIPLVHTITAPAAIRLVLPHLPPELHADSYHSALRAVGAMTDAFAHTWRPTPVVPPGSAPSLTDTVAQAVELRDEHVIKLAEVCQREDRAGSDERYARAAATLVHRLTGG